MTRSFIGRIDYKSRKDIIPIALFSDLHLEAKDSDEKRLREDLAYEHERGSRMLFNGDLFDCILPTDRKRYSSGRDVSANDAKLNESEDLAFDILAPYVNDIDYIGIGNHEISVLKYHHYDIIMGLASRLNAIRDKSLAPIFRGGYQGYIQYRFYDNHKAVARFTYTIFHHHGVGGPAPSTKGMLDFNRVITSHIADLYWLGHKHTGITDPYVMRDRLNQKGNVVVERCHAVFTAGYKMPHKIENYEDGYIIDYSDTFYNMQAQGYVQLNLKLNGKESRVDAETISK